MQVQNTNTPYSSPQISFSIKYREFVLTAGQFTEVDIFHIKKWKNKT